MPALMMLIARLLMPRRRCFLPRRYYDNIDYVITIDVFFFYESSVMRECGRQVVVRPPTCCIRPLLTVSLCRARFARIPVILSFHADYAELFAYHVFLSSFLIIAALCIAESWLLYAILHC